jgi:hypothetical protein
MSSDDLVASDLLQRRCADAVTRRVRHELDGLFLAGARAGDGWRFAERRHRSPARTGPRGDPELSVVGSPEED